VVGAMDDVRSLARNDATRARTKDQFNELYDTSLFHLHGASIRSDSLNIARHDWTLRSVDRTAWLLIL
jgi:hypothetical protein